MDTFRVSDTYYQTDIQEGYTNSHPHMQQGMGVFF